MADKCLNSITHCVDYSGTNQSLSNIKDDLIKLIKDLELAYNINPNNQKLHELKIQNSLVNLEAIDSDLYQLYNSLKLNDEDDLQSNFGMSVKLDMAKERLNVLKEKHSNLNKEWHSQDEHLHKISEKICKKEEELKSQSALCTFQGLTFGKMLWRLSNKNNFLQIMVSNEKLTIEVVKIYSGCLYGFVQTFQNQMLDPVSDEYQFILCLTGIFSNFATIPDGRFFLLHKSTCRQVLDQTIKTIPLINVPNGEDLKFLTLSTMYNIMICREGEEFVHNNSATMSILTNCIDSANSERIILMSLKIMKNLLENGKLIHDQSNCPMKQLTILDKSNTSLSIRKHANNLLAKIREAMHITELQNEKKGKSKLKGKKFHKETDNENPVTCYVVTDNKFPSPFCSKSQKANSAVSKSFAETCSSTSSSLTSVIELSHSYPMSKCTDISNSGSEPLGKLKQKMTSWRSKIIDEPASHSEKSVSCNISEDTGKMVLLENLNAIESEEIQSVQYQFPYSSIDRRFSISIGDNLQNRYANKFSVQDGNILEGEALNSSFVTVYRMSNSQLLAVSDNSFFPFPSVSQNDYKMSTIKNDSTLKNTQALTNLIEQELESLPTTSNKVYNSELTKIYSILSKISSSEDVAIANKTKSDKDRRTIRNSKKKRRAKSKTPVYKIYFQSRKHK